MTMLTGPPRERCDNQCQEAWPAGAPVDEAGLAHVEIANDNHLGEPQPVRDMVVLLTSMATEYLHTYRPFLP